MKDKQDLKIKEGTIAGIFAGAFLGPAGALVGGIIGFIIDNADEEEKIRKRGSGGI